VKRLVIVLFILAGIIAVCLYSLHRVGEVKARIHAYGDTLSTAIKEEDGDAARRAATALAEYWQEEQQWMIVFFRHVEVDSISSAVARLTAFADAEEYSDLDAELRTILWQIDHIWRSEQVRVRSILYFAPISGRVE